MNTSSSEAEPTPPTPETLVKRLLRLLDVENLDTDLCRGERGGGRRRVFGGEVIAQGLVAAMRSAQDKEAHSLHAYFMRPGNPGLPIFYRVVRDFDGRSFATRRVIATQGSETILTMSVSFQRSEEGFSHQVEMPDVPSPETLATEVEIVQRIGAALPEAVSRALRRPRPIEVRPTETHSFLMPQKRPPRIASWFRTVAPIDDNPDVHRAVLAYASDMILLATCLMPHGIGWMTPGIQTASLDHALWMHEPFRADEWLLYVTDSPWSGHARGFNRGLIFSRDGRLVASVAQEALVRRRSE